MPGERIGNEWILQPCRVETALIEPAMLARLKMHLSVLSMATTVTT